MPETVTVSEYLGPGEPWGHEKDWGPLIPHRFKVQGSDETVTWNRKPGTEGPKPGEQLTGELVPNGSFGLRFKKAQAQQGGGRSPEQQKQIVRQHSQEMAIRFASATNSFRDLDLGNRNEVGAVLNEGLRPLIDWFEKDAKR